MRVLLAFPPQWVPNQPYLAPAALVAYLQREGIPATQIDLNVRFYRWLLSQERMETIIDEAKSCALHAAEGAWRQQAALAVSASDYVLGNLGDAVATFDDPELYYCYDQYLRAQTVVNRACDLVSAAIAPSLLTYQGFVSAHGITTVDGVRRATEDARTNPFLAFYREQVLPLLQAEPGPTLFGLTLAANSQIVPGLSLARLIKEVCPEVTVVVGGYILESMIRRGARFEPLLDWLDFVVLGEGEVPLTELVRALDRGGDVTSVPGLVYRDASGALKRTENPPLSRDVLPTPDYSDLDLSEYFLPEPCLPIYSSDGCYYGRCVFCHDSMAGRTYRCRRAERVADDVAAQQQQYGVRHFTFGDDGVAPGWLSRFCEEVRVRDLRIYWECRTRIEPAFDRELLTRMHDAGCRGLYLGLETASPRLLKLLCKGTSVEHAEAMLSDCDAAGIPVYLYMMSHIPGEQPSDVQATVEFMVRRRHSYVGTAFTRFTLRPESVMAGEPERFGIKRMWRDGDLAFEGFAFETEDGSATEEWPADAIHDELGAIDGELRRWDHPRGSDYLYRAGLPPYEADSFLYRCRGGLRDERAETETTIRNAGPEDVLRPSSSISLHESEGFCWAFDGASGRIHRLSPQALWVLRTLGRGRPVREAADAFALAHGVPQAQAAQALPSFLSDLAARGLVERCEPARESRR